MYGAIIQGIMQAIGAGVAGNQLQKARGGYEAQLGKTKRVEPIREPNPIPFNWENALKSAFAANEGTRDQRYADANKQNQFNLAQAQRAWTAIQPYFKQIQAQTGKNALSFARGELPQDTVDSISRAAASKGIQNGFVMGQGGTAGQTNLLRRLGLTSLDLSRFGQTAGLNANQFAVSATPALANTEAQTINPLALMGFAQGNNAMLNESNRHWNDLENQAEWDNVATLNRANEMIATGNLASRTAEAQMWAELGSSGGQSGSAATKGGMSMFGGMA